MFFEKIFVTSDNTPYLSLTSSLTYDEKDRSDIFPLLNFFLLLFEIANGCFIFPRRMDDISEIKAEVVADGPAPSP